MLDVYLILLLTGWTFIRALSPINMVVLFSKAEKSLKFENSCQISYENDYVKRLKLLQS